MQQVIVRQKNKERISISSWLLAILVAIFPLEAYLGYILNGFPLIVSLTLLYMVVKFFELLGKKRVIIKINSVMIYAVYVTMMSVIVVIERRTIPYNTALFALMTVFFLIASLGESNASEFKLFIRFAPYTALVYFIIVLASIIKIDGEYYLLIKNFVDPNYLATGMVFNVGELMYLAFKNKRIFVKAICIFEVFMHFGVALFLGTRGGLFACGAVFVFAIIFGAKKPIKTLFGIGLLGTLALLVMISFDIIPSDMLERFTLANMLGGGGSGRTIIWANYLSLYKTGGMNVWLIGFGKDLASFAYQNTFGHYVFPHNIFVKALVEYGAIGLFLLVFMLFATAKKLYKCKNGMMLSIFLGFIVGALFLDLDNIRVFWFVFLFCNMEIKDKKFVMWRGDYGFFNNSTNFQHCEISRAVRAKRVETKC